MRLLGYTRRELMRRPARTLLTIFGIAIGVGALVSTRVTSNTAMAANRLLLETLGGRADVEVASLGEGGIDVASIGTILDEDRDVRAWAPIVRAPVAMLVGDDRHPVVIHGIDPARDESLRSFELRSGPGLQERDGVVLPSDLADAFGVDIGDDVAVMARGGLARVEVVGVLVPRRAAAPGAMVAWARIGTAARLSGRPGIVDALQVDLRDGVAADPWIASIRSRLPAGLDVRRPAERAVIAEESLREMEQGLAGTSVLSLVAGAFIILNTFLMNLGERRRQLALLRAVGVTRMRLVRLLVREAAIVSGIGTALGIGGGLLGAQLMVMGFEPLLGIDLPTLEVDAFTMALAALLGPGSALLATIGPAVAAGRRPVLTGLFEVRTDLVERMPIWLGLLGMVLVLATVVVAWGFLTGRVTGDYIAPAMALALVALTLAVPFLMRPLVGLFRRLAEHRCPVVVRMALRHLDRRPMRSAFTVGVMAIAVTVAIGIGTSMRANLSRFDRWYDKVLDSDFFVRASMPDMTTMQAVTMPDGLLDDIEAADGVGSAEPVRFLPIVCAGQRAILITRPIGDALPFHLEDGEDAAAVAGLRRGEIVLGNRLAGRLDAGPGDQVDVETPRGTRTLTVAGVMNSYTAGGQTAFLDRGAGIELFGLDGADAYVVHASDVAAADAALRALCDEHDLMLQTNGELRALIEGMLASMTGLIWGMLVLVFVVASLGTANTLTMNVLEQTREIGILRAIAMGRGHIRRYVLAQGVGLMVVALPPGVVSGQLMAWAQVAATRSLTGTRTPFELDLPLTSVCIAMSVVTTLVAAGLPAWRAARLRIFSALSWE